MAETTAIAKYGKTDTNAAREEYERFQAEQAAKRAKAGYLKLDVGSTTVRLMPPWKPGATLPIKRIWVHKVRPAGQPKTPPKATLACSAKNHGKPCIVCKKAQALRASGSDVDEADAFALSSQERFYAGVVDMEKQDKGVLLWEFGPTVYGPLMAILKDPKKGGDISDPSSGRNLIIDRTGKGALDTRYTCTPEMEATPIANRDWLNHLIDLDVLAAEVPSDVMASTMAGEDTSFPPEEGEPGSAANPEVVAGRR